MILITCNRAIQILMIEFLQNFCTFVVIWGKLEQPQIKTTMTLVYVENP